MRQLFALAAAGQSLLIMPAPAAAARSAVIPPDFIGVDSGDTAFVLAAAALALLVTLPGLLLYYGGGHRPGNLASLAVQGGAVAALASLVWIAAGYSIAFGWVTSGWIGSGKGLFLNNIEPLKPATAIPESAFALFQMSIAMIAPTLMVGVWAQKARFGWVLGFTGLWVLIVYAPIVHWIGGYGWLSRDFGTLDYAGGLAIHTAGGISALVIALLLGPRVGIVDQDARSIDPALSFAGAAFIWAGFMAIAGASALGANDNAASAMLTMHVAASAGALTWLLVENLHTGKPTISGFATGAVAGIAAISPAAVFIAPGAAIVFGIMASLICHATAHHIRRSRQVDDTLGVFAVHGVGGIAGTLLLAVFLSPDLGGTGYFGQDTMKSQLLAQAAGIGAVVVWSAVGSAIIALMVSLVFPMRMSEEDQEAGGETASDADRGRDID